MEFLTFVQENMYFIIYEQLLVVSYPVRRDLKQKHY